MPSDNLFSCEVIVNCLEHFCAVVRSFSFRRNITDYIISYLWIITQFEHNQILGTVKDTDTKIQNPLPVKLHFRVTNLTVISHFLK